VAGEPMAERAGQVGGQYAGRTGRTSGPRGKNTKSNVTSEDIIGETTAAAGNVNRTQDGDRGLHLASNYMSRAPTRGAVAVNFPVKSRFAGQTNDGPKKDNIKLQKPRPSFYVGIIGSPDLSTVKFQSVKNAGTRFGLLLGYSFNSRWAIEAGAYYGTKKYYTDGEYFDKSKAAYVLSHVDNLKVDGVCNMWEIPVNVRYNLSSGEKMKWFATAGISAYHMSREKYDCAGILYGNPWRHNWDTTSFPHSWSANLNLSVGYEQQLGKIGNLRLEPYVRIPMSGIGTGKLSIMSAGLNIGITRRIW
ncbi:MAG TPA: outer membrane beta-barrel protein, partial [Puia sp.]